LIPRSSAAGSFIKETPANEEIMEYMNASDRPKQLLFASAFVIESLSFRLTIMLFMKFYNVFSFRKTFNDKQSALQWLREMRSKQE
jgi:hypothetical protein